MTALMSIDRRGSEHRRTTAATASPVAEVDDFGAFYRREFPAMVALAASVGDPLLAEDLAQEAMLRAHRNWTKISGYDNPGAWLRRVTINLATSSMRRRAVDLRARMRMGYRSDRELPADPPGTEPLWAAVAELPRQQRAAIALFYLEDLPVREIASILGCAEATAKVHLHAGRTALATHLSDPRSPHVDVDRSAP